jgi:regulator of protease activity HflC (stomatin/prohibitin superfamily)
MTDKDIEQTQGDVSAAQAHGEADLAGEFLSRALRHSFFILKIIMAVLVVLFITSGIFRVEEDENALVLQFGKMRKFTTPEGDLRPVLGPGLHWAWPEPISEIVRIPVKKVQALAINSFWYFETEQEKMGTVTGYAGGPTLDPKKDGYCLARNESSQGGGESDYSIVHARCELTYRIDDIERFFRNIYYEAPPPGKDFLDVVSVTVDPLLEAMVGEAVVATMVNYSIDEAIGHDTRIGRDIEKRLTAKLDQIDSGIVIDAFRISPIRWPRQVNREFNDSVGAANRGEQAQGEARSYRDKILSEAGGAQAEETLARLKSIRETLKDTALTDEQRQEHEQRREFYLAQLAGTAQERLAEARAYRTHVVEKAKADAEYLAVLLPEYQRYPKLVVRQIYQEAIEEVLNNADEKFIIQPSSDGKAKEIRVQINPDPSLQKQRLDQAKKEKEQPK